MNTEMFDAIRLLEQEKGISNELVGKVIEEFLLAAYKKTFGTSDNAVVKMAPDGDGVSIYAKKQIVDDDDLYDPVSEIELKEAKEYDESAKIGDELLIEIDPKEFDRQSVHTAKQRAFQYLRDIQKDTLYSEFKDKVNEVIIGYYQRERNGDIYVNLGKTEGILPKRNQSPRETYTPNSRIKSLIQEVRKTKTSFEIVLTRKDPEFVKRIFENTVPEIYEQIVEIHKIVREAGYRTKIAVKTNKDDVDPVGACVGLKGIRIQAVMKELEGERIDVLRYDQDPKEFIRNALSPAVVTQVIILDESKRQALAIVPDNQLSLAIGKQGLNVKLANRLADWNIDVKTEEQFSEMDIAQESMAAAHGLFKDEEEETVAVESNSDLITSISELGGISERVTHILKQSGIELIETLVSMSRQDLEKIEGITSQDVTTLLQYINENVEFIEEGDDFAVEHTDGNNVEYDDDYECPECGHAVNINMTQCPNCGVGLSFEIEEGTEE